MATAKKTVKTDNKKTTAKKTTPKKTTTKNKKEETGVVDEFLNENIGGVITTPEVDENEIKEEFAKQSEEGVLSLEKTPEENIEEMLSEIIYQEHMKEVNRIIDEDLRKSEKEQSEELSEKWNELGLTNELQEDIKESVSNLNIDSEEKKETRPFTYVNSFMGANYD